MPVGGDAPSAVYAVVMGAVEGLTEFLPISSTGHLIVTDAFFGRSDPAFEIAIQAGAITAILVLYFNRLLASLRALLGEASTRGNNLLLLILVAALPAAVVGLLAKDWIEAMLFDVRVVASTLILGGIGLLVLESWHDRRLARGGDVAQPLPRMSMRQAVVVGLWQCLSLIPGTSRSGATIAGGLVTGLARPSAAEFSFLVGLPILYGACLVKIAGDLKRFTGPMMPELLLGSAAAFVTAIAIVVPFVRYLQRHTFRVFAWYRIAVGIAIFVLVATGVIVVE